MNKLSAHIVIGIFDLLALYGAYYVYEQWHELSLLIADQVGRVEIQSGLGVYLILLIIPVTHLVSVINWPERVKGLINKALITTLILLGILAYFVSVKFTEKINQADYFYCEKASKDMTFSEFRIFTKTEILCTS
jgi:hypothetical protein